MTNDMTDAARQLARYNQRANEILYTACADLTDAERKAARPAFFGSIHGTLNHIMIGDRIWLARFDGQQVPSTGLDAILFDDFEVLRKERIADDRRIVRFAEGLTPGRLAETIAYVNNQGHALEDPVATLVLHFFNHQTHHRGQIHDMLSQTTVPPPSLDLHRALNPAP